MNEPNRCFRGWAARLLVPLLIAGLGATSAGAGEDAWQERVAFDVTDLDTVKTYYEDIPHSTVKKVVALAMIDAPMEAVWEVVADQSRLGKGSGLIDMQSIEPAGDHLTEIYLILRLPWPLQDMDCRLLLSEDPSARETAWKNVAGHIVTNTGRIQLREIDGRTLVRFTLTLELGNILPQRLVNWVVRKKLPGEIQLIRNAVASRNASAADR